MKFLYDVNTKKLIIQEATKLEYNQVKIWLEREVENFRFTPAYRYNKWDGKIDLFKNGSINFGLWKEIIAALQIIGADFEVVNKKDFPLNRTVTLEHVQEFCNEFFKDRYILDSNGNKKSFFPYEHQIDSAYKALRNRYSNLEVATSGGKTLVLSIIIFYILKYIKADAKILLIVPNVQLVTQFYDDLLQFNTGYFNENLNQMDIKLQEIYGDKPRKYFGVGEPNMYISTYQSMSKIENFGEEFYKQFHTVIIDEAHMTKVESIKKILNLTLDTAEYRFGVSGTFPKLDSANWLTIESLTGPKVQQIRAKALQDLGIITPIKIKCLHVNHNNPEIEEQLKKIRKNPNLGADAYRLEGEFIRRSEKRISLIWKLINKVKSNTLILFNIIEYGTKIKETLEKEYIDYLERIKTDSTITEYKQYEFLYVDGDISKKDRAEVKRKMELEDGIIRVLVASYGTFSTGISINNIHNIILAEGFKSEVRIIQSLGRSLRLHETKKQALIFDIVDLLTENGKGSYARQGDKRKTIYNEHQYPYDVIKIDL